MDKKFYNLIKLFLLFTLLTITTAGYSQGEGDRYKQAIESGDKYFKAADYLNAKASYQVASQLNPNEEYPKTRLQESIRLLRIQMEKMGVYNDKLNFADELFNDKSYANAILAYEEALSVMPSQQYPRDQIELIRVLQAEEAQKQADYQKFITEGDQFYAAASYNEAIKKYDAAREVYPEREEAIDKIKQSNDKLTEIAAQQTGYQRALSEAEMYHGRKDYENELASYQKAAELKPDEALPQIKIRELNEFLRKYESYNLFVTEADELYINQSYAEAKVKYEQALEVLPDENYPKEIISKINFALAEKTERDKAAYDDALAKADELFSQENYDAAMVAYSDALRYWPEGEHARSRIGRINEIMDLKKAQEEAYANTITLADKLFSEKSYAQAKIEYSNANKINPFEQYPRVRIEEIDMIQAEIQNKLDQYENIILGADKLFNAGDYAEAKIQYLKAQEILSDRTYPADQIKMIDEILGLEMATRDLYLAAIARADEHFKQREWEDAKVDYVEANDLIPEEEYPDEKINEINEILARLKAEQETYTLALKNADQLMLDKDYAGALREYEKASEIFSEEEYPKMKIAEINGIMGELEQERILNENYATAIEQADKLYEEQKYNEAKSVYQEASALKPAETYPAEQIIAIDAALGEIARLQGIETAYAEAIDRGNEYFSNQQYAESKAAYTEALSLKEGEAYPTEKITEIDGILAEIAQQQATDEAYQAALAHADELFASASYLDARTAFEEAQQIKPGETYPADKIKEIDNILTAEAAEAERLARLAADYAAAISQADELLAEQNYDRAKEKYADALELKPGESYPAEKINEINAAQASLEQQRQLDASYADAIDRADKLLADEKLAEAKAAYQEALTFKPGEAYPVDQIAAIDATFAELQALDDAYGAAIANADNLFSTASYSEAKTAYLEASQLKPGEGYPNDKIAEIDNILAAEAEEAARLAKLAADYAAAISLADELLAEQNYDRAKEKYAEALELKPGESYPTEKINEIDAALASLEEQRQLDESYADAIDRADKLMADEKLAEAKSAYQEALALKPNEVYPVDQIAGIDATFAELQALNDAYGAAIANADNLFSTASYAEAKTAYLEASQLKPGETYPNDKIEEINNILAAEAEEAARLAKLAADYSAAISQADELLAEQNYDRAKEKYADALELKPDESYPAEKIAEIDASLARLEQERILTENYNAKINDADDLLKEEKLIEAKAAYQEALSLKPEEEYPVGQIASIDASLAEIARLQGIEENYTQTISRADDLYAQEQYEEAKATYNEALAIKAGESYPSDRIKEIDAIFAERARQEALLAEQNEQYEIALTTADGYFTNNQYEEARDAYARAREIKPDETYPAEKISEIDSLLAAIEQERVIEENYANAIARGDNFFTNKDYAQAKEEFEKALEIKSEEAYPGEKIAEIDGILNELARQEEVEAAYNTAIVKADESLAQENYEEARNAYAEALAVKPADAYASGKVEEVDDIIAENNRLKAIEESYIQAISNADNALAEESYEAAKASYEEALRIKAGETYPSQKIDEINLILTELAQERAIEQAYTQSIKSADSLFTLEQYALAKETYAQAVNIKEDSDDYPLNKIQEIDAILAEIDRQRILDADYAQAIKNADESLEKNSFLNALQYYEEAAGLKPGESYPKAQIEEINGRLQELEEERAKAYEGAIAQADAHYEIGNWRSAQSAYQTAVNIKSDEQYARDRLEEVTRLYASELEALKVDYNKHIADADNYFNDKIYDGAIENYRLAAALLPDEDYPGRMISRITQIINDNAITDVNKLAQVIPNNTDRRFEFPELPVNVRKQNYILIKARNMGDEEFKMLVNFGRDGSKTGGVVLKVPPGGESKDYIIRIGAIYRWFSEDNNWISIYPEGGDIEVALIRISKSD